MPSTNVFNEMCVKITLLRSITRNLTGVCNAVYFRLCIDLMHILPPVTAAGFDGSHHPGCAECTGNDVINDVMTLTFPVIYSSNKILIYKLSKGVHIIVLAP